ncbi:hypothetical protein P5673_022749 [Acropora cervicornis]|uniref:Ig-like domain-containing protein n=1 Tax=Acropora cervicornis TaxID=6130 RepID=A0AAD9UZI7_ACRCE|nr:hypothetical protein P5673_022749 [Acropora cervicornis]
MTEAAKSMCRDKPTTTPPTSTKPTILVKNVRITEGDDLTLNCTADINIHELSREGKPDISKDRTLEDGRPTRISSSATVKDSGKYLCKNNKEDYIFNVSVKGYYPSIASLLMHLGKYVCINLEFQEDLYPPLKADISRPEIQVQMNNRAEAKRQGLALGNYRTQLLLQALQRNIGTITVAKCGQ